MCGWREIAALIDARLGANAWSIMRLWHGDVVKNGLAYVNDMYNGLWIVKIEPKPAVVP